MALYLPCQPRREQSIGRPCRQTNDRSKRTCGLTSSIVPRGTSFHRLVELKFPPIGFEPAGFFMLLLPLVPGSSGIRGRQPICASRGASATIAFFIPRRLAICIAQASD